ncbi:winged helix-turn-helix transcriptional regulator [Acetobacter aceti]
MLRTVDQEVPPKMECNLTAHGRTLEPVIIGFQGLVEPTI